jgi:High potential iron-sulfur protein
MNRSTHSRRRFLLGTLGVGSAALLELGGRPAGAAEALPHLTSSNALAKALGYTDDAAKVDRAKYPTYKPGDECAKCRFYQGVAGKPWGPCQVFKGYDVNERGWCVSFVVKT